MTIGRVVNKNNLIQLSIDNSQIFEVVSLLDGAVLPIEPMRDIFLVWIQVIKDNVGIRGTTGCKYNNFCEFR